MDALQVEKPSYMTEDLEIFSDALTKFLERECVPHVARWEKEKCVDREIWHKAGKMGFLLPSAPEEFGGGAMVAPVPISQQFPDMTHEDIRRHGGEVRQEIAKLREEARQLRRAKRFKHFKPQHVTPTKLEAEADRIEKILNDAMGGDT